MRIPTRDLPQADNLQLVLRSAEAVSLGARTFQDIAREIGEYDHRQGRYYRRAAEILGLIRNTPGENRAEITPAGRQLFQAQPEERPTLLARAILNARVFQRVIPFLESRGDEGVTRRQLSQFIDQVTTTTQEMLHRRCTTIVGWLTETRLARLEGDRLFLQPLPGGIDLVEYAADDEPLSPPRYDLAEYETVARRTRQQAQTITATIDSAARERANEAHQMLTDLVAAKVRGVGAIPKRNRYIDLLARVREQVYLFEMKSTTGQNYHGQVRLGLSQLFEYRYIQGLRPVKLVLVTEQRPPRPLQWIVDYLVDEMDVLVAWDGDGRTLDFPQRLHRELDFLR